MIETQNLTQETSPKDKSVIKPFLTVEEARKILGISRVNMYSLIHQKGFPCIKISARRYIIPTDKLFAWAEQQIAK